MIDFKLLNEEMKKARQSVKSNDLGTATKDSDYVEYSANNPSPIVLPTKAEIAEFAPKLTTNNFSYDPEEFLDESLVPESFNLNGKEMYLKDLDTDEQYVAVKEILAWLYQNPKSRNSFYRLSGFAGTGKTLVISYFLKMCRELFPKYMRFKKVAVCTFTWKAALELRKRGVPATSIHSIFYTYDGQDEDESDLLTDDKNRKIDAKGDVELRFSRKPPEEIRETYSLIVVDEGSMVNSEMRADIEAAGVPVLYMGDHGQLPPISKDPEDATFMRDAESTLRTIRRQALDSPIIRLSMDIRNGEWIKYGKYGEGVFKVTQDKLSNAILLGTDQIICGKNPTRQMINADIRELRGYDADSMPQKGERIIGLNNLLSNGMFNGQTWEVEEDCSQYRNRRNSRRITIKIKSELGKSKLNKCIFPEDDLYKENMSSAKIAHYLKDEGIYAVDFAYAITCHKMQGSSAVKPIVFEERLGNKDFHKKWLYTAVTRATNKLIIVTE